MRWDQFLNLIGLFVLIGVLFFGFFYILVIGGGLTAFSFVAIFALAVYGVVKGKE